MLTAAHDLANFFTVIRGHRELLQNDLARALENLSKLAAAEARAMQIVRGMMAPQASSPAPPGVFDINEVARELISLLDAGEILGREVKLTLKPWIAPLHVRGDALGFFRALLNLCMNARNATADRIALEVGVTGIGCWIAIEDNGSGIEMGELTRLWERPAPSDGPHGHGLAIVKTTVKDLGGSMLFASEPGKGTKFTIGLPLVTGSLSQTGINAA